MNVSVLGAQRELWECTAGLSALNDLPCVLTAKWAGSWPARKPPSGPYRFKAPLHSGERVLGVDESEGVGTALELTLQWRHIHNHNLTLHLPSELSVLLPTGFYTPELELLQSSQLRAHPAHVISSAPFLTTTPLPCLLL